MARPRGNENLAKRARAYEMFVAGIRKAEIARELGVTRATVGNWCLKDRWTARMDAIAVGADQAADWASKDAVAATMYRLKSRLPQRVNELEQMCSPGNHPSVRLRAIQAWIKMATDKTLPVEVAKGNDLQLEEDLLEDEDVGRASGSHPTAAD